MLFAVIAGCGSTLPLPWLTTPAGVVRPSEDVVAPPAAPIRSAGFATSLVGWALTERSLWMTRDGGGSWSAAGPSIDYAGGAPKGAAFLDADRGWVVSEDAFSSV